MPRKLPELSVQKGLSVYLAALLLFVPVPLIGAMLAAAVFHELCHIAALICLGHPVLSVSICATGARIRTEPLPPFHEILCALAGPLGALFLLLFARWIPAVAVCALIQSFYNLLPIYPADGGRALRRVISLMGLGDNAFRGVEILTLSILLALGIWGTIRWGIGPIPLIFSICLVIPGTRKK